MLLARVFILFRSGFDSYSSKSQSPVGGPRCYMKLTWEGDFAASSQRGFAAPGAVPDPVTGKGDALGNNPMAMSQMFHEAELFRALQPQAWVTSIKMSIARLLDLVRGRKFTTVMYRSSRVKKDEGVRQSMEQTIRALRLAWHAYGTDPERLTLVESDDPNAINELKELEPKATWIQVPRCLFAALSSKNNEYIMFSLRRQYNTAKQAGKDVSGTVWSDEQLKKCPELESIPVHDEASMMVSTLELLSEGSPIVCGTTSNLCRLVVAFAARNTFPPAFVDIDGGTFYHAPVRPFTNVCEKWLYGDTLN